MSSINMDSLLKVYGREINIRYNLVMMRKVMFFSDKYKNTTSLPGYDYLFDYLNATSNNPNHFEDEKRGIRTLMGKIIEELQGTKAIIFDLRFNSGGYDLVSLEILRYFILAETKLYAKKAKLLNGYTETKLFSKMPNGWTLNFSNEVYLNMDGTCYEGLGVPLNKNINYPMNEGLFIKTLKRKIKNGDEAIEMVFK